MNKSEIIGKIARDKAVERQLATMSACKGEDSTDLQDLAQEIYLILLDKDEDLISSMYERGEMNYYISAIITNQVLSSTSPYRTKYTKYGNRFSEDTCGLCSTGEHMGLGLSADEEIEGGCF